MLNIDCKNCDGVCCTSRKRKLFVVLTPKEIEKFKDFSTKLKTKSSELTILKKDKSGNCIFYDKDKHFCKSYLHRPFECRIYPYVIHFDKKITFKIDSNVCHKTRECSAEELERNKKEWLKQDLPLSWIRAYSEFD